METSKPSRADTATALALLVLAVVLCLLGRGLVERWEVAASHQQDPTVEAFLGLAAAAAGAALLLWWTISLLSATASVLLERCGQQRAAATARRLSPAFMRRLAIAALSLQLASGVGAQAAVTVPGPEWSPTAEQWVSAPSNPGLYQNQADSGHPSGSASEGTRGPTNGSVSMERTGEAEGQPSAGELSPGWQPAALPVEPGPLAAQETRQAPGTEPRARRTAVTVLAGDTLWDIAAAHLGAEASDVQIALEWPRWYAANRGLIGSSPDVLLPGQILLAPVPS